jgi:hypothetical protein
MTIEDFNARRLAYRRSQVVPGLVFFALLCTAGLITVFAAKRIDRVGLDSVGVAVLATSYSVIGLLMYYVLAWVPRRRLVQLGLTCPKCGARLNGLNSRVTAAGRCGSCDTQVLESR